MNEVKFMGFDLKLAMKSQKKQNCREIEYKGFIRKYYRRELGRKF